MWSGHFHNKSSRLLFHLHVMLKHYGGASVAVFFHLEIARKHWLRKVLKESI